MCHIVGPRWTNIDIDGVGQVPQQTSATRQLLLSTRLLHSLKTRDTFATSNQSETERQKTPNHLNQISALALLVV